MAVVFTGVLVTPVAAQIQPQGWPDSATNTAKATKPVTAGKPAPAAAKAKAVVAPATPAPVKAAVVKPAVVKKAVVKPAEIKAMPVPVAEAKGRTGETSPKPASEAPAGAGGPSAEAAADAPGPVAAPAPAAVDVSNMEVVNALQQQAELLKRLVTEIESQRALMREQQEKINALETKAAATATAVPATATPPPPPPPPAITVETGGAKLKVSGLVQGWYTAADAAVVDTFRLRRAELKFSGDMSPNIKWVLMVDPAKALSLSATTSTINGQNVVTAASIGQSGRVLQDVFVAMAVKPWMVVEFGQQKVPLTYEGGAQSSSKLDTVERALFMTDRFRSSGYGDMRDLGLTFRGKFANGQLEYAAGVFNGLGEGFNDLDKNEEKTFVSRGVYRPSFIKGLQFGGSLSRDGLHLTNTLGRERQAAELLYTRGMFGVKAEYITGRDGAITREGNYLQLSARVIKPLQLVARMDNWDPDTRANSTVATVNERDWLGGFTYSLTSTGVWLQLNYIRKTFDGVIAPRNVFMSNIQTTW
jgi:hypothetical protein